MNRILTPAFLDAVRDYSMLLGRGYPDRSTLELVANRYRLAREQRAVLYRGIRPSAISLRRRMKLEKDTAIFQEAITRAPRTLVIHIDTLNVVNTLSNYLYGRPVFIATDGFLRDCGEVYESPDYSDEVSTRGLEMMMEYLPSTEPSRIVFAVDEPSPGGEIVTERITELSKKSPAWTRIETNVECVPSADRYLRSRQAGLIGTADSELADHADSPVIDIAHWILESKFELRPVDMQDVVESSFSPTG